MLIRVELLKKESTQIIGGIPEYERCAMRVGMLLSAGENTARPNEHTDALFEGFPVLVVNEPWEQFARRVNDLILYERSGGAKGSDLAPWGEDK